MKELEKIKTKSEILELQEKENITITINKHQARIIGFALDTEIRENDKLITFMQEELAKKEELTQEKEKILNETIINCYNTTRELETMKNNLKKYYGWLVE